MSINEIQERSLRETQDSEAGNGWRDKMLTPARLGARGVRAGAAASAVPARGVLQLTLALPRPLQYVLARQARLVGTFLPTTPMTQRLFGRERAEYLLEDCRTGLVHIWPRQSGRAPTACGMRVVAEDQRYRRPGVNAWKPKMSCSICAEVSGIFADA